MQRKKKNNKLRSCFAPELLFVALQSSGLFFGWDWEKLTEFFRFIGANPEEKPEKLKKEVDLLAFFGYNTLA